MPVINALGLRQNAISLTNERRGSQSAIPTPSYEYGVPVTACDLVEKAENHWSVSAKSILVAWAAAVIGVLVIFSLYHSQRIRRQNVFLPRIEAAKRKIELTKHHEKQSIALAQGSTAFAPKAPVIQKGRFEWLKPALNDFLSEILPRPLRTKESKANLFRRDEHLLERLGLDAVSYLQFLRLLRWLFFYMMVAVSLPLLCINFYFNTQTKLGSSDPVETIASRATAHSSSNDSSDIVDLQLLTAANITADGLFIHICFEYVVTGLVLAFICVYSSQHQKLIRKWTEINANEISFKTIMVHNLHIERSVGKKGLRRGLRKRRTVQDAVNQIRDLLRTKESENHLDNIASISIAHKSMAPLAKEVEDFKDEIFPRFERSLMTQMMYPGRKNYNTCMNWVKGSEVTFREQLDTICKAGTEIESMQNNDREQYPTQPLRNTVRYAFVTFRTAREAHSLLRSKEKWESDHSVWGGTSKMDRVWEKFRKKGVDIRLAPRSRNVVWKNIEKDPATMVSHRWIGRGVLLSIYVLNTVPLLAITVMANLRGLMQMWPALKHWHDNSAFGNASITIVGGLAPAGIAAVASISLPYITRFLNRWSGAITRSDLDKAVIRQLFLFLLIMNFVVLMLMGVAYQSYLSTSDDVNKMSWGDIAHSLGGFQAKITRAYISESSYWLSWFAIRSALACLELLRLPNILLKLMQTLSIKTTRDKEQLWQPPTFEFAVEYSHVLFALVAAMVYSIIAPLVVICGTIYFFAISMVHTNQLLFVEDVKETDGKMWRIVINRLIIATVLMHVLMTLTLVLKLDSEIMSMKAIGVIIATTTPMFGMAVLKWWLSDQFPNIAEIVSNVEDQGQGINKDSEAKAKYEHDLLRRDWKPLVYVSESHAGDFERVCKTSGRRSDIKRYVYGPGTNVEKGLDGLDEKRSGARDEKGEERGMRHEKRRRRKNRRKGR